MPDLPCRETLALKVATISRPAIDVVSLELVRPDGQALPPFTPGAHVDLHIPGGPVRQYSLCNDYRETTRYVIAVKRDANSRGGSRTIHETVAVDTRIVAGIPRNHFPLTGAPGPLVFIAGGIGITPIRSMVLAAEAEGRDWELHYCARSPRHAPFAEELRRLAPDRVSFYFGASAWCSRLDASALLASREPTRQIYCCGPTRLMEAVSTATAGWPSDRVHFEWFKPAETDSGQEAEFVIELGRSGRVLKVPRGRSILQVLRDHGIAAPSLCEEGVCGQCETGLLAGEAEHRDRLLSEPERAANRSMMVCVSRAKSRRLVLDL